MTNKQLILNQRKMKLLTTKLTIYFDKNDEESATVTQERENTMIDHIEIQYTITKNEDTWIVEGISSTQL